MQDIGLPFTRSAMWVEFSVCWTFGNQMVARCLLEALHARHHDADDLGEDSFVPHETWSR